MDFVFTEAFYTIYEQLRDDDVTVVDEAIRRLMIDHASGWARQGRIEGDMGGAWIVPVAGREFEGAIYWDYRSDNEIILVALVVRDL